MRPPSNRVDGLRNMIELVRLVDAGGATAQTLRKRLKVGIATVYRMRVEIERGLGVRIAWDDERGQYRIADWGVLDRRRLTARE